MVAPQLSQSAQHCTLSSSSTAQPPLLSAGTVSETEAGATWLMQLQTNPAAVPDTAPHPPGLSADPPVLSGKIRARGNFPPQMNPATDSLPVPPRLPACHYFRHYARGVLSDLPSAAGPGKAIVPSCGTTLHSQKCFTPSHSWLKKGIFSKLPVRQCKQRPMFVFDWHRMDCQARQVDTATRDMLHQFVEQIIGAAPASLQRFKTACNRLPDAF